ncbi:MAG TPA: glycosyltransferase family 4 protein [Methylomirabilota bacterium]|nr:glycosyltransferase family 4 protein [Methylomirabilota bacterium]
MGRRHLCLVTGGFFRPPRDELKRLERADRFPRTTYFEDAVDADIVDEEFLAARSGLERRVLGRVPLLARQLAVAYVAHRRYAAVISWGERLGLPFAAALKLTRASVPHVGLFSWISRPRKSRLLRRVHSHLDRIVLWNRVQEEFAVNRLGIPSGKIVRTNWYVDHEFFRPRPEVPPAGICAVGSEMRDYPTLLAALDGVDIPCHVAAGTARAVRGPALGDAPPPPTVTVGRKTFEELRELYARSQFVVIPLLGTTDTDNGISATLEAFAMAKPVIISRTVAQEVVRDGETGLFVPPGDPRALRAAIEALWRDPARCRRMGEAGRAHAVGHHRLEAFTAAVKQAVEEAVTERGRAGVPASARSVGLPRRARP